MTAEERCTFCRIVGTLLVSDFQLQDSEIRYLEDLYARLGVTEAERKTIEHAINIDDDVQELARSLSDSARSELLEELHKAAWADGEIRRSEAQIIVAIEELLTD